MQVRRSHDLSSPDDDKPAPPVLQLALAGLGWGLLTCMLCFAILFLTKWLLPPEYWGAHTGLSKFKREMSLPLLVFWVVIYSPILETFLGQLLPLEILRRQGASRQLSIFIATILWAIVHFISGGLLHAIVALGSGSMFSFVYLRYRGPSVAVAYATTTFARACNNIAILVAVFYGLDA
ncbi:type II CAAX prenyl endopeptidase Rce1 family protein [Janthinobacterium lividum]|uniref:CPBP family glutamic-type intramembrane protease n=1 Tax=Janthinobacterium lividum TaxID=29581 RepID=UPI0008753A86|nr:CPBP family glutamic-type intramembrane protease [Janthinobacterium lividum]MCC7713259.1 CPBP family intramembrane metalloprotease [Janthinobacterium lividum]OEZ51351.1 CAAX amino terminal protease self- immunity [Janthinobacterium lividum]WQE26328.1 CPBP family glutamic-type intramembrane protease [Janthinobacterium lividum]STQ97220.1 CAAX amino terminal protease self- immunity [Janthinobacterium lividum]